jgi:3-oxoacyl-[acyl-carrier protein] reductase
VTGSHAFEGRVALVTGGSGGIGASLCRRLADEGAAVAVHFGRRRDAADVVVSAIRTQGGSAAAFQADLSGRDAPDELLAAVQDELGPVDILAANAGLSRPGSLDEIDAQAFDETLAVNLRAPFLLARGALPHMRRQRYGRILFTRRWPPSRAGSSGRTTPPRRPACTG